MGVLQGGVVLAAKVVGVTGATTCCAAERRAYHTALVALAGKDLGADVAAWRHFAWASASRRVSPSLTSTSASTSAAPPRAAAKTTR